MGCVTTAVPFATIWLRNPILRVITVDIIVALYICKEIDRCAPTYNYTTVVFSLTSRCPIDVLSSLVTMWSISKDKTLGIHHLAGFCAFGRLCVTSFLLNMVLHADRVFPQKFVSNQTGATL